MNDNLYAKIAGASFLISYLGLIVGNLILSSIIDAPDYLALVYPNALQVGIGVLIESVNGIAVIGIAVIMFPILKPYNKGLTLGYVVCKVVEGAILIIGGILLLSLSTTLLEVRDWIYMSHAYIFILGALIFYYLLYRSKLIPRFISVWGVIACILLLVGNLLEIMGVSPEMLIFLFLPIKYISLF